MLTPNPVAPVKPVLESYAVEGTEKCPLSKVLRHPYGEEMTPSFLGFIG
jgi:hypothetical protein